MKGENYHSVDLLLVFAAWCVVLCTQKGNPIQWESAIKERTVMPFYFSVSIFLDLSYPLELLQVRQVVPLVVDYVIQ